MNEVKPTIHQDGTETVTLWGKTIDVTEKDTFTLFKRDFKLIRETKAKKTGTKSSKAKKTPTETTND